MLSTYLLALTALHFEEHTVRCLGARVYSTIANYPTIMSFDTIYRESFPALSMQFRTSALTLEPSITSPVMNRFIFGKHETQRLSYSVAALFLLRRLPSNVYLSDLTFTPLEKLPN